MKRKINKARQMKAQVKAINKPREVCPLADTIFCELCRGATHREEDARYTKHLN